MRVSTGHRARSPRGRTGEGSDNDEKGGLNTAIWRQELGRRVVRHPDLTAFPVGRGRYLQGSSGVILRSGRALEPPCESAKAKKDTEPEWLRGRPAGRHVRLRRPDLIATATKSMDAFDLVSKERVNTLRPACRSCRQSSGC